MYVCIPMLNCFHFIFSKVCFKDSFIKGSVSIGILAQIVVTVPDMFYYVPKKNIAAEYTLKILKFWTPEKCSLINLKFEQDGFTME